MMLIPISSLFSIPSWYVLGFQSMPLLPKFSTWIIWTFQCFLFISPTSHSQQWLVYVCLSIWNEGILSIGSSVILLAEKLSIYWIYCKCELCFLFREMLEYLQSTYQGFHFFTLPWHIQSLLNLEEEQNHIEGSALHEPILSNNLCLGRTKKCCLKNFSDWDGYYNQLQT